MRSQLAGGQQTILRRSERKRAITTESARNGGGSGWGAGWEKTSPIPAPRVLKGTKCTGQGERTRSTVPVPTSVSDLNSMPVMLVMVTVPLTWRARSCNHNKGSIRTLAVRPRVDACCVGGAQNRGLYAPFIVRQEQVTGYMHEVRTSVFVRAMATRDVELMKALPCAHGVASER